MALVLGAVKIFEDTQRFKDWEETTRTSMQDLCEEEPIMLAGLAPQLQESKAFGAKEHVLFFKMNCNLY